MFFAFDFCDRTQPVFIRDRKNRLCKNIAKVAFHICNLTIPVFTAEKRNKLSQNIASCSKLQGKRVMQKRIARLPIVRQNVAFFVRCAKWSASFAHNWGLLLSPLFSIIQLLSWPWKKYGFAWGVVVFKNPTFLKIMAENEVVAATGNFTIFGWPHFESNSDCSANYPQWVVKVKQLKKMSMTCNRNSFIAVSRQETNWY